jgi:hypothetical protein
VEFERTVKLGEEWGLSLVKLVVLIETLAACQTAHPAPGVAMFLLTAKAASAIKLRQHDGNLQIGMTLRAGVAILRLIHEPGVPGGQMNGFNPA